MSGAPPLHRPFLAWRDALYAKIAAAGCAAAILLYWLLPAGEPPNGGTLLGYTLGTLGLGLIAWLAWFGIRRKRYGGSGSMENLLSAHVYFGLALLVIATLHTGFRLHWNVHGLAYALMLAVIGSGVFGAYAFVRYPPLMTANRAGAQYSQLVGQLAVLDLRCQEQALAFPDEVMALVDAATAHPDAAPRPPPARAGFTAIARVQQELGQLGTPSSTEVLGLVEALTTRVVLLERLERDRRYRRLMLLWRAVHVPLTLGLLVALFIHVFVVFYDW